MSTYTPIATTTLTTDTTSITFSSIPQFYTDLVFVVQAQSTATGSGTNGMRCRINNDTGNNYSYTSITGNGSTPSSSRETSVDYFIPGEVTQTSATARNLCVFTIMNYANTVTNKLILSRGNTASETNANIGLYRSTSPVTSVSISREFGVVGQALKSGSTVSVYGIQEGGGYALGGDIVTTDGTYWYHAFLSSGAFTPTQELTADVLIVAGGGGGGFDEAGGGGAGGLLQGTISSLTAQAYTVTVGAGGANGSGATRPGTNGSNSVFSTHTANGGGGGGGASATVGERLGKVGGLAGGGASYFGPNNGGTANQGNSSPLTGYGNNGGNSTNTGASGGGGGGAGAAGTNGTSSSGNIGKGGNGLNTWSSWASATGTGADSGYYAGGGGGTSANSLSFTDGGLGGGGKGAPSNGTATAGTANTGGGGGAGNGAGGTQVGASGGSGIVIVRYAV